MSIRIVTFAEAILQPRQAEIVVVYREAFTQPPYNKPAVCHPEIRGKTRLPTAANGVQ